VAKCRESSIFTSIKNTKSLNQCYSQKKKTSEANFSIGNKAMSTFFLNLNRAPKQNKIKSIYGA
jgi:hypothetical protein